MVRQKKTGKQLTLQFYIVPLAAPWLNLYFARICTSLEYQEEDWECGLPSVTQS